MPKLVTLLNSNVGFIVSFFGALTMVLASIIGWLIVMAIETHVARPHPGALTISRYEKDRSDDAQQSKDHRAERNSQIERLTIAVRANSEASQMQALQIAQMVTAMKYFSDAVEKLAAHKVPVPDLYEYRKRADP